MEKEINYRSVDVVKQVCSLYYRESDGLELGPDVYLLHGTASMV